MNPMQRIQQIGNFMKGVKNPQQLIMQMLSNNTNPMAQNVLKMWQNGDTKGIEQFARNVVEEKGLNYEEEISKFKNNLGL